MAAPAIIYQPAIKADFVKLDVLRPSPLNPRKRFDEASLQELADNIAKNGVIVPLIVRRVDGKGEIIDGERRYRAATIAKAPGVPVIFKDDLTDGEVIEIMLLNQIQRQDLTPLEEAQGFKALIDSNPAKYSAAYIGDRIGRTETFVLDRIRLTKLIPILKTLLDAERILVGHAELLCRLKPEDQERAVAFESANRWKAGHEGLWQTEHAGLDFYGNDEGPEEPPSAKNLYRGLKPVTVKELDAWIKRHVRFDVEHMAAAVPLEFGQVAKDVEHANALPGRGKKVIAITHDYRVDDEAKDPTERTYGSQSWERADGKEKSKTCDYSVLGVIVAGRGQGTTLQVCVNRDKCAVHFGKVIKEREKNQKLRQAGKGGQANQNEAAARAKEEAKRKADQEERQRQQAAWEKLEPLIEGDAIAQVKAMKAMTPQQARALDNVDFWDIGATLRAHVGKDWHKKPLTAWLVLLVANANADNFEQYISRVAKPAGLNIKRLEAIRDAHQSSAATAAPATKTKKR